MAIRLQMVKTLENLNQGQKIKPKKSPILIRFAITFVLMITVFLFATIITYLAKEFTPTPVKSYEECVEAKGSAIQKTFPAVCVARSGDKFIEPLSEQEQMLLESPINAETVQTEGE